MEIVIALSLVLPFVLLLGIAGWSVRKRKRAERRAEPRSRPEMIGLKCNCSIEHLTAFCLIHGPSNKEPSR